ncbi:MAG: hypothetical protein AB1480_03790 [Nitrospirota bacterium]
MKAIIENKDGVYLITFQNEDYKDIFVVDELYLNKSKVDYEDFDLAEWLTKEEVSNAHKWEIIGFSQSRGSIRRCTVCGLVDPPYSGKWSEEVLRVCKGTNIEGGRR